MQNTMPTIDRETLAKFSIDETTRTDVTIKLRDTILDSFEWLGDFDSLDMTGLPEVLVAQTEPERGDYKLESVLGEGGMGVVFLARQQALQRQVAVKRLRQSSDENARKALMHEALLTGSLEHPNIVPIHTMARTQQQDPILVMKRIEGTSWKTLIRDPEHPSWQNRRGGQLEQHLNIIKQVATAVHFAHSRGVVHRDLKPDNVMLGDFGEVYVLDWGVAIHTTEQGECAEEIVGTPSYMAPEMVVQEPISRRTDVYLLGACLHEVLTGSPRHLGESVFQVLYAASLSTPFEYDESVPAELSAICNRACHRDPGERFDNASAFRDAIDNYLQHQTSNVLAAAASRSLRELERLFTARPEGAEAVDENEAYKLFGECRFGFEQALAEWPENTGARLGLQGVLELMIERHIASRNPHAAAALLTSLPEPNDELARKVAALQEQVEGEADARRQLDRIGREFDISVAHRQRQYVAMAMGTTLLAGIVSSLILKSGKDLMQPGQAGFISGVMCLALVGVGLLWRRALLANAINKLIGGLFLTVFVSITINRLVGHVVGVPSNAVFAIDALLMAAISVVAALVIRRLILISVPLLVGGAFLIGLQPQYSYILLLGVIGGSVCTIVLLDLLVVWQKPLIAGMTNFVTDRDAEVEPRREKTLAD